MQVQDQTTAGISWQAIGTIATFVGTILTVIVTWGKDRSASARRIQILEEATKYVGFWKAYTKSAMEAFSPDDQAALSKETEERLKKLGAYVEYTVTQPISQTVDDIPLRVVRRQTFKIRARRVSVRGSS